MARNDPYINRIPMGVSGHDALEITPHGEGAKLGRAAKTKKPRKPRDAKIYDAALVATLCGVHVEKAIATIASLMTHSKRENIKLKAATTLIELACELDVSAASPTQQHQRMYVLVQAPQTIAAAAEEARRRRLANSIAVKEE